MLKMYNYTLNEINKYGYNKEEFDRLLLKLVREFLIDISNWYFHESQNHIKFKL